jgi:outer membrane protein assembly factor BamB
MRVSSLRGPLTATMVLVLAACASDRPKPTPLADFTPALPVRLAWSSQTEGASFVPMPVLRGGALVVSSGDGNGTVQGLDPATGQNKWQASVGSRLSAPAGSDGRFVAAVNENNELVLLDQGKTLWTTRLPGRVATPPLVAGERVFVLGVDRSVRAFDALDGRYLWLLQRAGDSLTLSQPGVLMPFQDTLLVGQGHRLAALDPTKGTVKWELPMANPRGTNEVERVADLVGPALRQGNALCARLFQTAVACADVQRATLTWTKNASGVQAAGADAELVVGADSTGRLSAWRAASGDLAWSNEALLHRELSGVAVTPQAAVVGDLDGQVHFLHRANGQVIQRAATDGSAVVGAPVIAGDLVIVSTRRGGVFAFRLG